MKLVTLTATCRLLLINCGNFDLLALEKFEPLNTGILLLCSAHNLLAHSLVHMRGTAYGKSCTKETFNGS